MQLERLVAFLFDKKTEIRQRDFVEKMLLFRSLHDFELLKPKGIRKYFQQ